MVISFLGVASLPRNRMWWAQHGLEDGVAANARRGSHGGH